MTQIILSANRNRSWPGKADLAWFSGVGVGVGGWMGSSGFGEANGYIWNGGAMGPYCTSQGPVCDWVTLLNLMKHCQSTIL